ncbi:MAG: type II secretion system protein [Candidatus Komeilibacteria bacterium]
MIDIRRHLHNHDQRGMTLIEVIIYVAIVSAILTTAILYAWDIIGNQTKNAVLTEVNQNARYILQSLSLDWRQAANANSIDAQHLTLTTWQGDNIQWWFDPLEQKLYRQVNAESPIVWHSDVVAVTGDWDNMSDDQTGNFNLQLVVAYRNPAGHVDWQAAWSGKTTYTLNAAP